MSETILNTDMVLEHGRVLREEVFATDVLGDDEKAPLIRLLDAVLESASLLGVGKISILANNAITEVRQALETAMANAELSEFNEEEITYE